MPLASAKENIKKFNLDDIITTKLGNGLKPLTKDYDVITICGIGGILMTEILANDLERIKNSKRLILCPNTDSYNVRKFLNDNNFKIEFEEVVYDYKFYEIIVCSYNDEFSNYNELELKYGPCLLKEKSNEFIKLHEKQLNLLSSQLPNITNSEQKDKILSKINEIKKILV
jgi:tRNA (adenine22-N1)-methyltransferase